jgi:hypothetical protein
LSIVQYAVKRTLVFLYEFLIAWIFINDFCFNPAPENQPVIPVQVFFKTRGQIPSFVNPPFR